ncbi:MAG: hypothetical protein KAT34_00605 [Candidatus Aminicenantes bacterium]|nr:hypothetical protein [Candidatus Aminicenantes bacterium]
MKLYTYCLRYDDGAAPNPYWGMCSLAICKPVIRRTAGIGDWIVGFGSTTSPIGYISNCVVYAMKVTKVLSMSDYDKFCQEHLPGKIPDLKSSDFRLRVGDCIYDFADSDSPQLRPGVHDERNKETDLGGKNVLLSDRFYYFGDKPTKLKQELHSIIHKNQGHKSHANDPYADDFKSWLEVFGFHPNILYGEPQLKKTIEASEDCRGICSIQDRKDDEVDEICSSA